MAINNSIPWSKEPGDATERNIEADNKKMPDDWREHGERLRKLSELRQKRELEKNTRELWE